MIGEVAMTKINEKFKKVQRPEKVIQFGEGGFLRGFVDWMLQKLNDSGKYNGSVVVVQPIEQGMCDKLSEQDCMYTHVMRGIENGEAIVRKDVIDVISRCVKPYENYAEYLKLALNPDFRLVISNTTEAGIAYVEGDKLDDAPPKSFPAKVTALLYERFKAKLPGFIFIPCELIDNAGDALKNIVLKYADDWNLSADFVAWINNENIFCNTLVDRIVTGYPKDEDMELGYIDNMVNTSELFHFWAIEGPAQLAEELPFDKIGLNVIWTDNLAMYKKRKVRILNGAHTSLVPYAMLNGFDTVKSCVDDEKMLAHLKKCVYDEIVPTLDLPQKELIEYADAVVERFANPYIKHYLSSIALNSVSKFKVRVLPSILEYIKRFDKMPDELILSLAALIKFYKTDMKNDDKDVEEFMAKASTKEILAKTEYWGEDLSFLLEEVKKYED